MAQLPIAIKATAEQERLERQATEDLTAALQKWAAALLRNVNSFNLNTMLDRLNNPRWAGNIAMRDALIAIMQRAAKVGVDAGIEALYSGNATKAQPVIDAGGVDWELVNVDAAEWALNYSHLLMNDISSTTRRAIQREIAYYVENSMTINQLRDRIMSLSTFSETRANRIAVTETTRAYAEGNMRAWSDLDYVERVRWQTANDDLVCPICGPLNQQTVAKGELFAGRYYSPPAHVNCRCGVSPVVTGAEEAGAGAFDDGVQAGLPGAGTPGAAMGTPVSSALDLGGLPVELRREIEDAIKAIDSVHGDGNLPKIAVKKNARMNYKGQYVYRGRTYDADHIRINPKYGSSNGTLIHEIGHFLDHQAIGEKSVFASASQIDDEAIQSAVTAWRDAVKNSAAYKSNVALPKDYSFERDGNKYRISSGAKDYLVSDIELWARSYQQFITEESNNPALLGELKNLQNDGRVTGVWEQWETDDFAPIRSAMRKLFQIKGWMQ